MRIALQRCADSFVGFQRIQEPLRHRLRSALSTLHVDAGAKPSIASQP